MISGLGDGFTPKKCERLQWAKYWEEFFSNRSADSPFEWYGSFDQLGAVLEKYLKPADKILQIGCGSSQLAEQLYDNGYRNVSSIDSVESVIAKKERQNQQSRPQLVWRQMDATKLSYESESFSVVLDKGTLDALCPTVTTGERVKDLFEEVDRVLISGKGRYITVTLAQEHILSQWIHSFSYDRSNYMLRVHKATSESGGANFNLPVFLLVATKLKPGLNLPSVFEFVGDDSGVCERKVSGQAVMESVKSEQEYSWFCHVCRNKILQSQMRIKIEAGGGGGCRYEVTVVDDTNNHNSTYAVMVVPHGREADWLFATDKGRLKLVQQTGYQRLAVVTLCRGQKYKDIEAIKAELNNFVMHFAPKKVVESNKMTQYLSVAESIGSRWLLERGHSLMSGEFVVEDVDTDPPGRALSRRFVFLKSPRILQTEALVYPPQKDTGCSGSTENWIVDTRTLVSDYHKTMLSAVALSGMGEGGSETVKDVLTAGDGKFRTLILGLGGGSLAMNLYEFFPQMQLVGVDLDGAVVMAGKRWFGLVEDSRLVCHVADGIKFLQQAKERDEIFDVIAIDVSSAETENPELLTPPEAFLEETSLRLIKDCLEDRGCLAVNLIPRSCEASESAKARLTVYFPTILSESESLRGNEVLVCFPFEPKNVEGFRSELKRRNERFSRYVDGRRKALNTKLDGLREPPSVEKQERKIEKRKKKKKNKGADIDATVMEKMEKVKCD